MPLVDPHASLVRQVIQGDRGAARVLVTELTPHLLRVIRLLLGTEHPDGDDVMQETLMAVLRGLATFRFQSTVLHYARCTAARVVLDAKRKRRLLTFDEPPDTPATDPSPRDEAVASQLRRHLRALLDHLPEVQAETLTLHVVLDMSNEEVAAATGVPFNTVRSRLRLAKEALRRRIASDPRLSEFAEDF